MGKRLLHKRLLHKINSINKDVRMLIYKEIHRYFLKRVNDRYKSTFGSWYKEPPDNHNIFWCPFQDTIRDYVVCNYRKPRSVKGGVVWVAYDNQESSNAKSHYICNFIKGRNTGFYLSKNY